MKPAPLPHNEAARLEALRQYEIMDTEAEQSFDDLAFLASYICDAPVALISLLDRHRQWFKSRVGMSVQETARDLSFCAHAILQPGPFIVRDTLADERFASNPLVTGEPRIRFYAGAPLTTSEGFRLGTLCVLDREPRELTPRQRDALQALSRQVITQLELRRELTFLRRALERLKAVNRE